MSGCRSLFVYVRQGWNQSGTNNKTHRGRSAMGAGAGRSVPPRRIFSWKGSEKGSEKGSGEGS